MEGQDNSNIGMVDASPHNNSQQIPVDGPGDQDPTSLSRWTPLSAQEGNGDVVVDVHDNFLSDGGVAAPSSQSTAAEPQQTGGVIPVGAEQDIVSILREAVSVLRSGFRKDEDSLGYDSGGGEEENCFAKTMIKNRLWVKSSKLHKEALETWEQESKFLTDGLQWRIGQSIAVQNQMYQLIGLYVVFEGVLLTVVAQSNLLHCNNWWTVFSLSALGSMVTIAGVYQLYRTILGIWRVLSIEGYAHKEIRMRSRNLIRYGDRFKFHQHAKDREYQHKAGGGLHNLRCSLYSVILVLVIFACLFLVAIVRILCHPGTCP